VHRYPPQQVVEILRAARVSSGSLALGEILECFRRRWLRWARCRGQNLEALHEDAVQEAQMLVLKRIDQLRDPACVEAWANAIFLSVLRDLSKKHNRRARWAHEARPGRDPDEPVNRFPDPRPGPEDDVSHQERRRIVREVVRLDEVAWLRFEEGLPEKEIEEQTGLSRDAIATRCKRFRRVLQRMLADTGEDGKPFPISKILEGSGLSRELRVKLEELIVRLRRLKKDDPDEDD
jgi:RNA polymerase sigma factor (sigma-70 family)